MRERARLFLARRADVSLPILVVAAISSTLAIFDDSLWVSSAALLWVLLLLSGLLERGRTGSGTLASGESERPHAPTRPRGAPEYSDVGSKADEDVQPSPHIDLSDSATEGVGRPAGAVDQPRTGPIPTDSELLGEEFLIPTLESRVAVARRALRPLSLIYFEVLDKYADGRDSTPTDAAQVDAAIRETLRESDIACRTDDGAYVMLLEDTSEDGAVWTAERVRRNLHVPEGTRLFRAGVAAYPTHGLAADELQLKASHALTLARDWQRDRIEVAHQI